MIFDTVSAIEIFRDVPANILFYRKLTSRMEKSERSDIKDHVVEDHQLLPALYHSFLKFTLGDEVLSRIEEGLGASSVNLVNDFENDE